MYLDIHEAAKNKITKQITHKIFYFLSELQSLRSCRGIFRRHSLREQVRLLDVGAREQIMTTLQAMLATHTIKIKKFVSKIT